MKATHAALLTLLVSATVPAQNLLTNGDFEQGMQGWTRYTSTFYDGIESIDINGDGSLSRAFACTPLKGGRFAIYQRLASPMKKGKTYYLRWQVRGIASSTPPTSYGVNVIANPGNLGSANGQFIRTSSTFGSGKALMGSHGFAFTCTADIRDVIFGIRAGATDTPAAKSYLDNVELYEISSSPEPWISTSKHINCYLGSGSQSFGFDVTGQAHAIYIIAMGTLELSKPLAIPGIGGQLELDLSGGFIPMFAGQLDNSNGTWGTGSASVLLPQTALLPLRGLPLKWLPIQRGNGSPMLSVGKIRRVSFL
jgi:hypothetical protein